MFFPDAKLVMPKPKFKANNKVVYTDKEGNEHKGKVMETQFVSLTVGYNCLVELEEPIKGVNKMRVSETKLKQYTKDDEV